MTLLLLGGVLTLVSTLILTPVLRRIAIQLHWVDDPNHPRKIHDHYVPRIGGVAMGLGILIGLLFFAVTERIIDLEHLLPSNAVLLGGLVIGIVGFLDDTGGMGFKRKFLFQLVVAYTMVWAGFRVDVSSLSFVADDPFGQALISLPLTLLWIVGLINAVNLLDGLDGLAGGLSIIAFLSLAVAAGINGSVIGMALVIVTVMATAGFLFHNFKSGYIFMGDTGSTLLGFLLAMFALENTDATHSMLVWAVPCLALGIPILDTLLSMGRRILARRSPFSPDQDHIHHRMRRVLGSQRKAVGVLYLVGICLGSFGIFVVILPPPWSQVLIGLAVLSLFALITWIGYTRTIWRILLVRYYRKVKSKPKKRPKESLEPAVEVANADVLEEVYS